VTEGVWVKLRCNKLIPATRYLMQIVCTPAQAARSLRTIGAGDRMRMGSPVFRSRVWRALPSNAGETMSGRSGCTGRQLPRRQQGEDEAVPHGWQADANPPSPARLNESPVHGARLSSPIPTRRTTGTEANLAPCRSHSRHAAPKANPEANGRPAFRRTLNDKKPAPIAWNRFGLLISETISDCRAARLRSGRYADISQRA
jgi:hypothetical protein